MPQSNDEIEQGDSIIIPPEGEIEEQETIEQKLAPAPKPVPTGGWDWIGSPSRPEAKEHSDGISDLFTVTDEDVESSDEALSDLTDVDIEKDILDSDDDGSLDDLVSVTEEDIMGDEMGQRPSNPASQQRRRILPKYRRTSLRYIPPTSLGRSG